MYIVTAIALKLDGGVLYCFLFCTLKLSVRAFDRKSDERWHFCDTLVTVWDTLVTLLRHLGDTAVILLYIAVTRILVSCINIAPLPSRPSLCEGDAGRRNDSEIPSVI